VLCCTQEIANFILQEQSPKRLYEVRGKLYELLVNCLPPELILRKLALELFRKLDDELRHKVSELAAFYEHRLQVNALSSSGLALYCSCCRSGLFVTHGVCQV
jgi:hypothetical protein